MENNLPVISKRVWSMVRLFFSMLRKGFTKPKILIHLNLLLKRPRKLAGKVIASLISHHHSHRHATSAALAASSPDSQLQFFTPCEYEFSCSNTPNYSFFSKCTNHRHFFACSHAPPTLDDGDIVDNNALKVVLEMLRDQKGKDIVVASPAAPRSGRIRMARQVRVTDSPFPVQDDGGDHQVDKEAADFIKSFYNELRKQG